MLNKQQIILIQMAVKQAGLRTSRQDGRYRLLLAQYRNPRGKPITSCKELNNSQIDDLLAICESMGWRHPDKKPDHYRKKIAAGDLLVLIPENAARVVTVKDNTGNIKLRHGDYAMDDANDVLILRYDGSNWREVGRSEVRITGSGQIDDSLITEPKLGSSTSSGITTGAVACKRIDSATLKALLTNSTQNLFAVKQNDLVLCVKLFIETAGGACTVTVGPDANVESGGADTDGYLKAGDANSTGVQSSDDVAGTYMGDLLLSGAHSADGDGYVTVTSSADISAGAFVGGALMFYIPA